MSMPEKLLNSGIVIPRDEYEELTEALATVFRIGSRFTPRLIERLDLSDGDADFEDATDLEDDWTLSKRGAGFHTGPGCPIADAGGQSSNEDEPGCYSGDPGPGCPISDPGGCEHDGREPSHEY